MKNLALAALGLSVIAVSGPALAQDPLTFRVSPNAGETVTRTSDFRTEALKADAVSIESSRIALERSRNPRVRAYADRTIVLREATSKALLPEGTSLSANGTVVPDRTGFETRLDNPVGVILAPVTIAASIGTGIVGGVLGGVGIVDNSRAEPGRRVALGAERQARIDRLKSAPNSRAFDREYVAQQAQIDARTLSLYSGYARAGDDAQGRQFANEVLPYAEGAHSASARLAYGSR
jgi:predicted outer membrane protein